jgi:hypothetical protein
MSSLVKKWLPSMASVVGSMMLLTSCATTGHWEPDFPEKGSAKGGASQLMRR